MEQYAEKIENIKYAIVDLYDYTIFNYDASLSNQILFYWSHGGIMEHLHNFRRNKNYVNSHTAEMKDHGYYPVTSDCFRTVRAELFDGELVQKKHAEFIRR